MLERQLGKIYVLGITLIAFYISATFNACSDVGFVQTAEMMERLSNEGIVINQGARYTTSTDVTVSLYNPFATKMLISDSPDCSTGEWEKYAANKVWKLSSNNETVAVYAKFIVDGEEGECLSDDIVHDDIPANLQFNGEQDLFSNLDISNISFAVSDSGSGVAEVRCSLSKNENAVFKPCATTIALSALKEGAHSFFVKVSDQAGNITPIQDFRWVTDYSAPTSAFNSTPAKITGSADGAISFSASDALSGIKKSECKIDDGEFAPCTSPVYRNFNEGPHKITVVSFDKAGNKSEAISYEWVVDLTAPVVLITKAPTPFSNSKNATFEFSGKDGEVALSAFQCQLNGQGYTACASPYTYANLNEGSHTFSVKAKDAAMNDSEAASYSWIIDTTSPLLSIGSGPNPIIKENAAQYTLISSDSGSGVEKIECQLDGGGYNLCNANYAVADLAAGPHTVNFRSFDNAGNMSAVVNSSFMVDNVAPTIAISKGPLAYVSSSEATIEFAANDLHSGVDTTECRLSTELSFSPCSSPKTYIDIPEGKHTVFVRAIDKAGNLSLEAKHDWEVDMTAPEITFGQIPNQVYVNDSVKLLFSVSDVGSGLASYNCYLDATPTENCTNNVLLTFNPMSEGSHSYRVIATDNVGNASAKEITWTVVDNIRNYENTFNIKKNNSVDILFVVDNSGSMKAEQKNMADRINGFLSNVEGLDWRIGVVTTDSRNTSRSNADGRLLEFEGTNGIYFITPNTENGQELLSNTIQTGTGGSGDEEGIHSTYRTIERSKSPGSQNSLFFRENAHLAVVLISDEDETPLSGHINKPQDLINHVKSVWPGKNFVYNSIVWNPSVPCSTGEQKGLTYIELSNLTNGIVGNVCSNDYTSQLVDIGKKVVEQSKSLTLNCPPIDTDKDGSPNVSLSYAADGTNFTPITAGFVIAADKVVFENVLPEGIYKTSYSCIVTPTMIAAKGP